MEEDYSEVGYKHDFGPHFRPWLPRPPTLRYIENPDVGRWEYSGQPLTSPEIELREDNIRYVDFSNIISKYHPTKGPIDMVLGVYLNTHGDIFSKTICRIPPGMVLKKNNIAAIGEQAHDEFAFYSNSPGINPLHTPRGIANTISQTGEPKQIFVHQYMELISRTTPNFAYDAGRKILTQVDREGQLIKEYTEGDFSETCKTYITRDFILQKNYDATPSDRELAPLSFVISFAGAEFDIFSHSTLQNRPRRWNDPAFIHDRTQIFLT